MSDCSRSAVFLLSGSVLQSWQHYGMLSALPLFRRRLKAISSAGTVRCFRCFINLFSSAQSYPVSFGSGPVRKSVSGVDGDVGGLYVIVYGWCWSMAFSIPLFSCMINKCFILQIVSPSFGVLLFVFKRLILWGGFLSPTCAHSVRNWHKRGCKSLGREKAIP